MRFGKSIAPLPKPTPYSGKPQPYDRRSKQTIMAKLWRSTIYKVVKLKEFVDDNCEACFCVYSLKLDSITFVWVEMFQHLQKRGIKEIQNLPNLWITMQQSRHLHHRRCKTYHE